MSSKVPETNLKYYIVKSIYLIIVSSIVLYALKYYS